MPGVRLKRCVLCMTLPLLGIMVLVYGVITRGVNKNDNPGTTLRHLAGALAWRKEENGDYMVLMKPVADESRILGIDPADVVKSHTVFRVPELNQRRKTLLMKLSNLEGSSENTTISTQLDNLLDNGPDNIGHVHAHSLPQEFDVGEDLEGQYLQAVKPKLQSSKEFKHTKLHIVIVTNRRSGSSFLGEFFNQHPSVFFQFEPLKITEWKREFYPDLADCLRHVLKCEFDKTPYLVEYLSSVEPFHRANSRVMANPPLCNLSFPRPLSSKMARKCEPLQTIPLIKACKTRRYCATKLIRLGDLSSLKPLAFDPDINLKIIHLVRDPRAIYISRSKVPNAKESLKLGKTFDDGVRYICRRIQRNLNFVRSQPPWLQGKYKLVRYEDIAQNPQKLAEEIYNFAGMGKLPQEVVKWIDTNTKVNDKQNAYNYYSTSRNASRVSEAWRYHVPLTHVLRMQDICRTTLKKLGYLEVDTESELQNKSKSLVDRFPGSMYTRNH